MALAKTDEQKKLALIDMAEREETRHHAVASNVRVEYTTFKQSLDQYVGVVARVGEVFGLTDYTPYTWDELRAIARGETDLKK